VAASPTRTQADVRGAPGAPWAVLAVAAAAGGALVAWGASPYARLLDHGHQPSGAGAQAVGVVAFVAAWMLMIAATMLPTAAGLLRAVGRLTEERADRRRVAALVALGFLMTWAAVGYAFRAGDVLVHAAVDSVGWLDARPQLVAAGALVVAGAFQFSELKHRCLVACRSPASFLHRHWHGRHPGRDAVRVGVAYGSSCVGCCWALMLVMFGLGMVSLGWMLILAAVMAAEKTTRFGARLSKPVGIALLAAGALVAAGASPASAAYTIRTKDGFVTSVGPLRSSEATVARATSVFGMPSVTDPVGDGTDACRLEWRRLRFRAVFANFGIANACDEGLLQAGTIRSRRFRTWRGLRVGDRSSTIPDKHPRAEFRRNTWWLASVISQYGEEATRIPTVEAIVQGGRVKVLRLWVGAAGD
jgi:predicted metal-binding membrane protein